MKDSSLEKAELLSPGTYIAAEGFWHFLLEPPNKDGWAEFRYPTREPSKMQTRFYYVWREEEAQVSVLADGKRLGTWTGSREDGMVKISQEVPGGTETLRIEFTLPNPERKLQLDKPISVYLR